jgi:hypothetical protein
MIECTRVDCMAFHNIYRPFTRLTIWSRFQDTEHYFRCNDNMYFAWVFTTMKDTSVQAVY